MELAEGAHLGGGSSLAQDRFQAVINLVRQKAAFICFQKLEVDKARELFIRGKVLLFIYWEANSAYALILIPRWIRENLFHFIPG